MIRKRQIDEKQLNKQAPSSEQHSETSQSSFFTIPTPFGKLSIKITDSAMNSLIHLIIIIAPLGLIPLLFWFVLAPHVLTTSV